MITLYNPDTNVAWGSQAVLGTPILGATSFSAIDQSGFDNLALQFKDTPWMDEIRFGASAADVAPIIPEPSTFALVSLLGLAGFLRRRR